MSNPNIAKDSPATFKPGQSGNPKGRPKREWTVAGLIEKAMEEEKENGIPYKKAVYDKLVKMAESGDIQAIKEVNQRLDGMPKGANENNTNIIGDVNILQIQGMTDEQLKSRAESIQRALSDLSGAGDEAIQG